MEDEELDEDTETGGFEDEDEGWFDTWQEKLVLTFLVILGVCLSPLIILFYCRNKLAAKFKRIRA